MELSYRTETVVDEEGSVRLRDLPFEPGETVEVIVLALPHRAGTVPGGRPLRGSVLRYDDPTEPVAEDDWDVLK